MALGIGDPVEAVARVVTARRDRLLRINRRRLRWEDLEDCYSQATLELVARAQRDPFVSQEHILNALEQKFSSRIDDRRRAVGGRSPIETALARAVPVDAPEIGAGELEDPTAEVMRQVAGRIELSRLREVAAELTEDQRLVLACQVSLSMECGEFCRRFGWSSAKFRKVAQRARTRLRGLVAEYQVGDRCRRLEPDIFAYAARAATDEQTVRVEAHLANCTACASRSRGIDRASRQVAALIPAPALASVGLLAKLAGAAVGLRRALGSLIGRGAPEAGAVGVAGGSAVGAGAVKLGVAAACLAGAAGGYTICIQGLPLARHGGAHHHARSTIQHASRAASRTTVVVALNRQAAQSVAVGRTPVVGSAAALVAHREFGSPSAHAAGVGRVPGGVLVRPARAQLSGARGAAGQTQREFSGFEH